MNIGWNFPSNNYGKVTGISEAGIETFRGNLFHSLAKEICQNSLDARVDMTKPVFVDFQLSNIKTSDIDGFKDLFKAIRLCKDFWNDNAKTVNFFDKSIRVCSKDTIRVLRISDFNTTGLPGSKEYKSSPWQNLVKSSGVSDKNGTSGGSYGIGKSAPFACSDLRTVYYNTLDNNGIKAYQGVANLVSFREEHMSKDELTQGTGYYGEKSNNSAVFDKISLDGFIRNECGTDIYILGFIDGKEWKDEIIKSVLDGYLISILNEDIKIKVENVLIDKDNISELIEQYKDDIPLTYNYYQVLTSEETVHIRENFNGLGCLSLYVLIHKDLRRQVLMARSNGMKVFDKKNISGTIQFAGVCILEDESLNSYFREMETPQHNAWESDRHTNRTEAKRIKTELFRFIKETVLEIGRETVSDEMDAIGAGEIIPDIADSSINSFDANVEDIANEVRDFSIEKVDKVKVGKGTQISANIDMTGTVDANGIVDSNGEFPIEEFLHGNGERKNGEYSDKNGYGIVDNNGNAELEKTVSVKPLKLRLFMFDTKNRMYKLTFTPEKDANNAYIEILISGEQSNTKAVVNNAKKSNGEILICSKNRIHIGDIRKNTTYTTMFSVSYDEICSMGMLIHGYKI